MNTIFNLTIVLLATVIGGCIPVKQSTGINGASSSVSSINVQTGSAKNLEILRVAAKRAGSDLFYQLTISENGKVLSNKYDLLLDGKIEIKLTRGKSHLIKLALGPVVEKKFIGYVSNADGQTLKPTKANESLAMKLSLTDAGRRADVTITTPEIEVVGSYALECTEIFGSGYYQKGSIVLTETSVTSTIDVYKFEGCSAQQISTQVGTAAYAEASDAKTDGVKKFNLKTVSMSSLKFLNADDALSAVHCGKDDWTVNEEVNLLLLDDCDTRISDINEKGFTISLDEVSNKVKLVTDSSTYLKVTE